MFRLFLASCFLLSSCFLYCPFLQPPPPGPGTDGGVAADAGEEPDAGVAGDPASDGGCVDPALDGGWDVPNDTAVAPSFTLPDCAARGARSSPRNLCELKTRLFGLWARCTPADGGTLPRAAPMLELRADSWHALEATADGGLVRRLDLDGSGVLELLDADGGAFEVSLQTTAGGWLLWRPAFEVNPGRLRVVYDPAETVDYGRITVP